MKFKLEHTFDISDGMLLIDANDGIEPSEEYTSLDEVPKDVLEGIVYNYLEKLLLAMGFLPKLLWQ